MRDRTNNSLQVRKEMAYEYLNTRLRFMKAKLLKPQAFAACLEMRGLDDLIGFLAGTDYGPEIERSSVEYSGYKLIEDALMRNGQRVFSKLYHMAPEGPKTLIQIILERFEVFNLKTILRGFHVGAPPEETRKSLYPTILYPTAFYQELLQKENIGACIDYLVTVGNRYYKPLTMSFPDYERTRKLAALENSLDSFYFGGSRELLQNIGDENAALVRMALGTEVDVLNLVYALRVVEEAVESEEKYKYILKGGERLSAEFIRELIDSGDKASFFKKLENTYYATKLGGFDGAMSANDFQERLENFLYREQCRLDAGRIFDIHLALVFIWRKTVEMTNLRVIASGLWRGAPRQEIERRLIHLEAHHRGDERSG